MWSEQLLQYRLNGISANQAGKMFGLPCTLKDHICIHTTHETKPGPSPFLSAKEEDELKVTLFEASKILWEDLFCNVAS